MLHGLPGKANGDLYAKFFFFILVKADGLGPRVQTYPTGHCGKLILPSPQRRTSLLRFPMHLLFPPYMLNTLPTVPFRVCSP